MKAPTTGSGRPTADGQLYPAAYTYVFRNMRTGEVYYSDRYAVLITFYEDSVPVEGDTVICSQTAAVIRGPREAKC